MEQSHTTNTSNPLKYNELESIRGIAALLVVFFHLPKWNPVLDFPIINNSYLMVELFFVLSGFVIFNAYNEKIRNWRDLLKFQFLRLARLYPIHIIFLFAFAFIEIAKYIAESKFGISGPNSKAFQANNIYAFADNVFLIAGLYPTQSSTFNGPSWSICVEFYTYLLFAAITLFAGRSRYIVFGGISCAALVVIGTGHTNGYDHIFQCLAGFFLGCLTAVLIRKVRIEAPSYLSLLTLMSLLVFLQIKSSTNSDPLIYPLSALLVASLVLSKNGVVKRVLGLRCLMLLGNISYSLYMSHALVEWVANQAVRFIMKRPEFIDAYGNSIPGLSPSETLLVTFLIVLSVVSVSAVAYRYVESPWREKSRKFASRW